LQNRDEWRALGLGQHGQRDAKEQREDGDLENLILRDGLSDVLREDVEQNLLPAFRACRGRDGLDGGGQRDSGSGL
jgi:hypothetical protein